MTTKDSRKQSSHAEGVPLEGNQAVAHIAYKLNEVIVIYPITPSSPMAEYADQWSTEGKPNLWGQIPTIVEMQSEGGAAGAVHGALMTGSLTTTFTASQGLLLMIPNMYKIAGELTPAVFHVAARTIATQGLSIFGDHSDVMAVRQTGWAMLCSNSVQEAMDMALIAHAATLESRIPFVHFFDGFRTSHEISKIQVVPDEVIRALVSEARIQEHRQRGLSPDRPTLRGTAQNPDVHFQAKETVNPAYDACSKQVQSLMDAFGELTGRHYSLYEYHGAPDAERVIVMMGSGAEAAHETVDVLQARGEKVGVLKVRLYRPLDAKALVKALPASTRSIAVLDRTKEPGALGEPLYLDVVSAVQEEAEGPLRAARIVGGRYGLSSKEFTPAMVKAVFDTLSLAKPKNHFTVGIHDDVSHTSLAIDKSFTTEPPTVFRALFYGLGSDGTVGANKNSIKIISENTPNYAQGYFVYDSKKAGAMTVSHLRFGPDPIRSSYLVTEAQFVGCHEPVFLDRYDMLSSLAKGGTFLLNSAIATDHLWSNLPRPVQERLVEREAKLYVIDAYRVAKENGLGRRINTIMQVCYFAISGVLPKEKAIEQIKKAIKKTYAKKGEEIVAMNMKAVDEALNHLESVALGPLTASQGWTPALVDAADPFVHDVLGEIAAGRGDDLPVSAFPCDGCYPTATTRFEKRNLAQDVPVWEAKACIQCAKCAIVCPHAVIRAKVYDEPALANAPATFQSAPAMDRAWKGKKYTLQVSPEDCTGCGICVEVCPAKSKVDPTRKAIHMTPHADVVENEKANWNFFTALPEVDRHALTPAQVRQQQLQQPLFEFSSACPGCGETPYLKLLSQLYGERALIANATGCSSIYGGNLPTTPWAKNGAGRGPAWANSLFEDNAEFGLGLRVSVDNQHAFAVSLLKSLASSIGDELVRAILEASQKDEAAIDQQRERVAALKTKLARLDGTEAKTLLTIADVLVRKSVWIVGGDGWAYDIGFGGLDHVLASGKNVKVLILDTEVYSNTGGQMSKSTPKGAIAKFAAAGKAQRKKDLGLMAMTYEHVYVAAVAMGSKDEQTVKAFLEAEAYDGPAVIIAYSHCVAHGIDMRKGMQIQKAAVDSGHWILYRYNPDRIPQGLNPLQLDCGAPTMPLSEYLYQQNRFRQLTKSRPELAKQLLEQSEVGNKSRRSFYEYLAARPGAVSAAIQTNGAIMTNVISEAKTSA